MTSVEEWTPLFVYDNGKTVKGFPFRCRLCTQHVRPENRSPHARVHMRRDRNFYAIFVKAKHVRVYVNRALLTGK